MSITEAEIKTKFVPPADIVAAAQCKFGTDVKIFPLLDFLVRTGLEKGTIPNANNVDFYVVTYEEQDVVLDLDRNGDPVRGRRPTRVTTIFNRKYPRAWWSTSSVGRKGLFRRFIPESGYSTIQKWGCLDHPDAGETLPAFSEKPASSLVWDHIRTTHPPQGE